MIFILFFFVCTLSGCWDANEPDRMVYAQSLGIDYKDGKYIVYLQLMNLSMLAKADSGGGNGKQLQSEIGRSTGKSLEESLFNIYKTSQRRIHWGHLNNILLTESALKQKGLQNVADIIDRYIETHYQMRIYSTADPLADMMNLDPPINMSTYLSKISDPNASFGQYSFIQSLDLREMVISHYEPPHEIHLPNIIHNNKNWAGEKKSQNIGEINGVSIITDNALKGMITKKDANGFKWIQKKFKRAVISLPIKENETVGLTIKKRKVDIEPVIINGKVQFEILIKIKAVINKLESHLPVSEMSKETKKLITKEVKETYLKGLELDADVYRLSNILYRNNLKAWEKIQMGGKIPLSEDSIRKINVEVMILDGGKQRKIPTLD